MDFVLQSSSRSKPEVLKRRKNWKFKVNVYFFCFQLHFNKWHPTVTLEDYYAKVIKSKKTNEGQRSSTTVAVKRERTESDASELSSGYVSAYIPYRLQ